MTTSILTPLQRDFLRAFFTRPASQFFFLTGGTAISEFYLHHRYSEDIDLFTIDHGALQLMESDIPSLADELGCRWKPGVKAADYRPIFLQRGAEPSLKIDFVREAGPQLGEHQLFENVIVDSELNIAVNKVAAIFGRTAPKDFVDLYFLLKKGYDLDELMQLAKEKDLGFTEFYFANMLRQGQNLTTMPRMIQPLALEELHQFFQERATQIMVRLKPPE
jgi:predicted nucleotidyltransferase component of viral defense system